MSFAVVLEGMTLITYIVILSGGKQMRETGWKVLTVFLVFITLVQCGAMALVSYLFDNDDRFYPGWKLDTSWILTVVSMCLAGFNAVIIYMTIRSSRTTHHDFSKVPSSSQSDFLLVDCTKAFAALTRDFKEAAENAVSLPEDDPDTFERFLQWLYSGRYILSGIGSDEEVDERYLQLAQLYTLADKLEVPPLKHEIIDELFMMKRNPDKPPQTEVIAYVYENTGERSPLRKLMVAWLVWHVDFRWYSTPNATNFLSQCPEFAADLAVALAQRLGAFSSLSPFYSSPDKYYEDSGTVSSVQSPTGDTWKSSRLVSTQKQGLNITPTISTGATPQSTSGPRPLSGTSTFGGGGSTSQPGSCLLRVSEPLRSPGLFSNASSDTTQTPTFGRLAFGSTAANGFGT
ncbi:conserved hypothetical protein [Uncinocarpus reesii 1704]|uniref:BTB domain-containing protein n=1 Tax=Uncinocarpus reesii (strain UAMH 1704) TaxID=336963 RepID=C4JWW0_UNCRE|nr:uncharacterized protein UREG_06133 [Uncinocarpus reesii 1704]EEP81268.1 conserved hypothetical protein [Uncinocarpus reesii 1704]